jgi:hypothetical protein
VYVPESSFDKLNTIVSSIEFGKASLPVHIPVKSFCWANKGRERKIYVIKQIKVFILTPHDKNIFCCPKLSNNEFLLQTIYQMEINTDARLFFCLNQNFFISQIINEITKLITIIEVIGKKNLKLGLSTTISPGNFPIGSFEIHGQRNPVIAIIIPAAIKIF